jgi:predicted DNA-binding protein (MmcQ/YjbR family)
VASRRTWNAIKKEALSYPGAWEDHPWGETVVKVNKKIFVFLGSETSPSGMSVKLTDSHDHALSLPDAVPTGYGMGKAGWVTLPFAAAELDLLLDWVEESYRNIATKTLVKELEAQRGE